MVPLNKIEERFEHHLRSVDELIGFDKIVLDTCINHVELLNEKLKKGALKITNPNYLADGTLKAMKQVRQNDSLKIKYRSIFNSCLVLQVSYFTSTIDDIFDHTATCLHYHTKREEYSKEYRKSKNDINFQNMHSTIRTFKKYLDIEITKDAICNTIILAQCSRHAIVHSLGKADAKFITQVNAARPRDIKDKFDLDETIEFSEKDLVFTKIAMGIFVSNLCREVRTKYNIP